MADLARLRVRTRGRWLLALELWDRAQRLPRFQTTVTGIARVVLPGAQASAAGTVTLGGTPTVEGRLEARADEGPGAAAPGHQQQQRQTIKAAEQRMSEAIDRRVRDAEAGLSARPGSCVIWLSARPAACFARRRRSDSFFSGLLERRRHSPRHSHVIDHHCAHRA